MSQWCLDTSVALKLMVSEEESASLADIIDQIAPDLVACYLLEPELRRAAQRMPSLSQAMISQLLDTVNLFEVPPSLFREAGLLPGAGLRSLDALHVATAVRLGVDEVLTYDLRMAHAAREVGLHVLTPSGTAS